MHLSPGVFRIEAQNAQQFDPSCTIAVVLGARNETRLQRLEKYLEGGVIPYVAIREPDAPWNNQLMAIGIMPIHASWGECVRKDILNEYHLLPEDLFSREK